MDVTFTDDLNKLPKITKLGPFINSYPIWPNDEILNKNIKFGKLKSTVDPKKFLPINSNNINLRVRPKDLPKLINDFLINVDNYENNRKLVGAPSVSYLSAFLKFGLISIRQVYNLAEKLPSVDKDSFQRELFFRDFYYSLAYHYPNDTYLPKTGPKYNPLFISEEDQKNFEQHEGRLLSPQTQNYDDNYNILHQWQTATTYSKLVNAGMKELIDTGYMHNRTRMITVSWLYRDENIYWKYGEQFFAQQLTDYDWTINAINHMNIAKIGPYPKYTQDFSIQRQENDNKRDKQLYYDKFL